MRKLTQIEKKIDGISKIYKYVVTEECRVIIDNCEIKVPKGFLTDGSSGAPDWGWSWLFHDYLYSTHEFANGTHCSRQQADEIMYNLLLYERQCIYSKVYRLVLKLLDWKFEQSWETSGNRGPEYLPEFNNDDNKIIEQLEEKLIEIDLDNKLD